MPGSDGGSIAIFAAASTALGGEPINPFRTLAFPERTFSAAAPGNHDMRQFSSLLRSTRSRIGRRFAEIVAIAAASLPDAGA
jgi:hypothetical protein